MGIFSFLKFIKKKKVKEIIPKKLAFSEIESWLEQKNKETEIKEKQILSFVKGKIENFNSDLRTKIITLKEFDVESKKSEVRIKAIVNDSREGYIDAVENLITNLENIKEIKFSDFVKKIDKIFFDFSKASFKNYERATILIGNEMANIKKTFKSFSKELLEIFDNNKNISELFATIEFIKSKLNSLNSIKKNMIEISETIKSLNEKIIQKEKENQELSNEIQAIKQSEDYKNMLKKKEKINTLKQESKDNIFALKQLINFKALANFFHINEEQMSILKKHKENFYTNFEKDNGKNIMDLLDESKLNTLLILEKVNLIKAKKQEIANYKKEIKKDNIQELSYKIKEILEEVDNLKIEKIKEEKRYEKLRANKDELINLLKQELGKMNAEVV